MTSQHDPKQPPSGAQAANDGMSSLPEVAPEPNSAIVTKLSAQQTSPPSDMDRAGDAV